MKRFDLSVCDISRQRHKEIWVADVAVVLRDLVFQNEVVAESIPSQLTDKTVVLVELNTANRYSVYIPKRFAHGFLTLADETVIHYLMSEFYQPGYDSGFRFDDPAFNIQLPFAITALSKRDAQFSDLLIPAD